MESVNQETQERSFKVGRVTVELNEDGSLLEVLVVPTGECFEVFLTLPPEESKALFRVLKTLSKFKNEKRYFPDRQLWAFSQFHYIAPLFDRPDIFWISVGPLNSYVKTEHMEIVFNDLKLALSKAAITLE
jgi:hypothetical protein